MSRRHNQTDKDNFQNFSQIKTKNKLLAKVTINIFAFPHNKITWHMWQIKNRQIPSMITMLASTFSKTNFAQPKKKNSNFTLVIHQLDNHYTISSFTNKFQLEKRFFARNRIHETLCIIVGANIGTLTHIFYI